MDINKAKENLKGYLNWLKTNGFSMAKNDEAIQIILSEREKKDKIINLMAEDLMHIGLIPYRINIFTKEQLIEQYANKVEEDKYYEEIY